ncbi:hypothetical protein AVM70_16335 (plasmid) [Piscirickettsia salmonis]|nr:hypothetical protein [Piscirickettsia salmonis]APS75144.1 hypothetical protein AVM70_16335 [Piscirickettsia salmonis]
MPYKYPKGKGWDIPKQKYGVTNWAKYTDSLRNRGRIDVWISEKAIEGWYKKDRVYDGTGTPFLYSEALLHSSKSDQFWRFAYPAATLTSN